MSSPRTLFVKKAKDEKLAKFLESVLTQILVTQATEQIKAESYKRTEKRQDYRIVTRAGTLPLKSFKTLQW